MRLRLRVVDRLIRYKGCSFLYRGFPFLRYFPSQGISVYKGMVPLMRIPAELWAAHVADDVQLRLVLVPRARARGREERRPTYVTFGRAPPGVSQRGGSPDSGGPRTYVLIKT